MLNRPHVAQVLDVVNWEQVVELVLLAGMKRKDLQHRINKVMNFCRFYTLYSGGFKVAALKQDLYVELY
jgi:hypothetical protein